MPQIFHRSFNTISRVSIFGAIFMLAALGAAWAKFVRSDYLTGVGMHRDQPIPFSHQHHVGGLGIDCRYCHTSVESSSFAGIPPTRTCLNCHSQIWVNSPMLEKAHASFRSGESIVWNRVHNLPGFVYFDHSIHLKKGIGCASCHGRVDQMPLTRQVASLYMEWCLDCHRHPERHVRPRDQVFNLEREPPTDQMQTADELVRTYRIERKTDCSVCHR
jgi:Cytochrome c7 and related cytochrome c